MRGVMRWQFRRSKALIAVYSVILLLAYPVVMAYVLAANRGTPYMQETMLAYNVSRAMLVYIEIPCMILFALIFALFHFGFLHRRRETDLYHSLPIGRTPMFLGRFLTGLLSLSVPQLLGLLLQAAVVAGFGRFGFERFGGYLIRSMLIVLLVTCLVYSFLVLMAVCSGTLFESLLSTALLSISWPAIALVALVVIQNTIPGMTSFAFPGYSPSALNLYSLFSPILAAFIPFIFDSNGNGYYSGVSLPLLGWLALLTVLMFLLAFWLYRKRKSELAESPLTCPSLKIVIRVLGSTAAGMLGGYLVYQMGQNGFAFLIGTVVISLLVYLLTELLYFKSFRLLKHHLPAYGGALALFAAFMLCVGFGLFGLDSRLPEREQVSGVCLYSTYDTPEHFYVESGKDSIPIYPMLQSEEAVTKAYALNQKLLEYERAYQYPYLLGRNESAYYNRNFATHRFTFNYWLGNTGVVQRNYKVSVTESIGEDVLRLYEEAKSLLTEEFQSEEFVMGVFPVAAVDAAASVSRYAPSENYNSSPNSLNDVEFSKLPDEAAFRRELEAALISDFKECRYLERPVEYASSNDWEEEEKITYSLNYPEHAEFTARGGVMINPNLESVAGKTFRLSGGWDYSVTTYMPKTYALLESLYNK